MYRPPGIVDIAHTNLGVNSNLDDRIWNAEPTIKLFTRENFSNNQKMNKKQEEK